MKRNKTFIDGVIFSTNICLVVISVLAIGTIVFLAYIGKLNIVDVVLMSVLELTVGVYVNIVYTFCDLAKKYYMLFGKYRWLL